VKKVPTPLTAAEALEGYLQTVLPRGTPEQIEGARLAFMSGVWFLLKQFHDYIGDPATSEAEGEAYLTVLKAECDAFLANVRARARPPDPREQLGQMNYTTPDPDHIQSLMNDIGHRIGERMPAGYGFMLMIFNYGEGGSMFYISSGEREDMMRAMREFIQKQTQ
jgi:hypothetical protein